MVAFVGSCDTFVSGFRLLRFATPGMPDERFLGDAGPGVNCDVTGPCWDDRSVLFVEPHETSLSGFNLPWVPFAGEAGEPCSLLSNAPEVGCDAPVPG